MKITSAKGNKEVFKPFSLTVNFESEAEVIEYFSLFNYAPIVEQLPLIDDYNIREQLKEHCPSLDRNYSYMERFNKFMTDLESKIRGK